MRYCTRADMVAAFGEEELIQMTDRLHNAAINDAVLEAAVTSAEAEINIWLEGRYKLPLASVPDVLRRIALDLTRYALWGDVLSDHPVAIRHQAQLKTLRAIAKGDASLGLDRGGVVTPVTDTVQISQGRNDFGDRRTW